MERLTIRNSDGSVSQPTNLNWSAALELLADYEDTNLTPELIRELLDDAHAMYKELEQYKEAKKDGRLVVLPCRIGDEVYQTKFGYNDRDTVIGYNVYIRTDLYNFRPSDIGKTVFLCCEEAEAALRGGHHDI